MKKISVLKLCFTVFSFFLLSFIAEAKYTQTCTARYMTENGWSKKYTVDVNFLSGSELNQATNTYNYSTYSVYAVIFWGKGQASVIKLSSYLMCGSEVDKNCIRSSITDLKGNDQDGDEWKICVGDYCF
jgi:hypothetical protein